MKILSNEQFETLTKTVATVFEDLNLEEIAELNEALTKTCRIGAKPFKKVNHSLQMKRNVYDFDYETVHYIIERIFRDEEHGYEGETMFVTYIEHTDGGTAEPETIEYTIPLNEMLHEIVGQPMWYEWH